MPADDERKDELTEVIFVATRPHWPNAKRVLVDVYTLEDGTRALRGYSSMEALKRCCGEHQQWVALDQAGLLKVMKDSEVQYVCLNVKMPTPARPLPVVEEEEEVLRPRTWLV